MTDPLLWADIPYNADPPHCNAGNPRPNGSADPSIGSLSHEHNETITDPLLNAWINGDNSENGDLCALKFGPPLGGSSGPTAYNQVIGTGHYLHPGGVEQRRRGRIKRPERRLQGERRERLAELEPARLGPARARP